MTIDLTGINNENEFYTHHYLSAILEGDLKEVLGKWSQRKTEEDGYRPPYDELGGLGKEFFAFRNNLERERKQETRLELQRELLSKLLPVFGYDWKPNYKDLDEETGLSLLLEVNRSNGSPEIWVIEALDPKLDKTDPLALTPNQCQYTEPLTDEWLATTFEEIVTKHVLVEKNLHGG
jgi:hypothetical protein